MKKTIRITKTEDGYMFRSFSIGDKTREIFITKISSKEVLGMILKSVRASWIIDCSSELR